MRTILYCLPQIRKEWGTKYYLNQATANFDSKYQRFPNKINIDYREESNWLLELAFRRIKLSKDMENAILILMMLIEYGADINELIAFEREYISPTERDYIEMIKSCLYGLKKGFLADMKRREREELVLDTFYSMWKEIYQLRRQHGWSNQDRIRDEVAARQRGSSRNPPATSADGCQQEILVPM